MKLTPYECFSLLALAANEPWLTPDERQWRREVRSAWLRLVVLLILVATLTVAKRHDDLLVHANLLVGYGCVTLLALVFAWMKRGPAWLPTIFATVDALLMVILIHEHLFAKSADFDHRVTAPTLAVGLVMLTHVALRLQPRLVVTYAVIVLAGWLGLLVIAAYLDPHIVADGSVTRTPLSVDVVLAAAFGFCRVGLLAHDQ